jgi:hypothetical protein
LGNAGTLTAARDAAVTVLTSAKQHQRWQQQHYRSERLEPQVAASKLSGEDVWKERFQDSLIEQSKRVR